MSVGSRLCVLFPFFASSSCFETLYDSAQKARQKGLHNDVVSCLFARKILLLWIFCMCVGILLCNNTSKQTHNKTRVSNLTFSAWMHERDENRCL